MKLWSFKVIKDTKSNKPLIQVNYKGEKISFHSEKISATLLSKMKQITKDYLGHEVTDAEITVHYISKVHKGKQQ